MKLSHPRWLSRVPSGLVVGVATFGPLGRRMPAPGTWGSLAGLLLTLLFCTHWTLLWYVPYLLVSFYVGVAFCGEAEKRLGRSDPGMVILDEVLAMPLCFIGWHYLPGGFASWMVFLAGFGLFRFFDILKPLGISRLQHLPGGWGVMADDYAAALASCLSLHLLAQLWVAWH